MTMSVIIFCQNIVSPDLNPLVYDVWSAVEREVSKQPPKTITSLKSSITWTTSTIDKDLLNRAFGTVSKQISMIMVESGFFFFILQSFCNHFFKAFFSKAIFQSFFSKMFWIFFSKFFQKLFFKFFLRSFKHFFKAFLSKFF